MRKLMVGIGAAVLVVAIPVAVWATSGSLSGTTPKTKVLWSNTAFASASAGTFETVMTTTVTKAASGPITVTFSAEACDPDADDAFLRVIIDGSVARPPATTGGGIRLSSVLCALTSGTNPDLQSFTWGLSVGAGTHSIAVQAKDTDTDLHLYSRSATINF